jgi:hypothetical protein
VAVFPGSGGSRCGTGLKDAGAAEVIELTQTGCQFVESEDVDHVYKITKKAGYDAINARSTN